MALAPINIDQKVKKSKGGLFGKIAGGAIGGVAGALTGNPMAAISGASAGMQLGGMAGEAADPTSVSGGKSVPLAAMAENPEVKLAGLLDAQRSASVLPKVQQDEVMGVVSPAIEQMRKNLRVA